MKKIIIAVLLCVLPVNVYLSDQVFSDHELSYAQIKELLAANRTTNVVIFNDVDERMLHYLMPWDEEQLSNSMRIVTPKLMNTLVDNKNIVLCSKADFLTLQLLHQLWWDFISKDINTIFSEFKQKVSSEYRLLLRSSADEYNQLNGHILMYKEKIMALNRLYDEINLLHDDGNLDELKLSLDDLLNDLSEPTVLVNKLFYCYVYFEIIIAQDYICKDVSEEFIVFIPRHLVKESDTPMMQDLQLGLRFSALPNYQYKRISNKGQQQDMVEKAAAIDASNTLGEKLLKVLNILVWNREAWKKWISHVYKFEKVFPDLHSTLDRAQAALPFFNIFIDGHGGLDQLTAGISIKKRLNQKYSDFEQFLLFLNNSMKTKSLSILSCFPGGKTLLDTFNVKKPFDSSILDQITYPIINVGMLMSSTGLAVMLKDVIIDQDKPIFISDKELYLPWLDSIDLYSSYFSYMNQVPSNYEKAFRLLLDFYPENTQVKFTNYIGVKFPHLSWYSAYEFKKHSKQISQIEAFTKKEILFEVASNPADRLKVVLLGASMVPVEIVLKNFSSDKLPVFLPVNYFNQNYVIRTVNIMNTEDNTMADDIFKLCVKFLPIPDVSDPINIVIKHVMFNQRQYHDVYFFTQLKLSEYIWSGCMFTDDKNQHWIGAWLANQPKESIHTILLSIFDEEKFHELIAAVEAQACKGLEQFPGLDNYSFKKLEDLMEKKAKGLVPEKIVQSHEEHERNQILARVIETIHSLHSPVV